MLYRRSYLFRLASDPVAWLWSGFFDLEVPAEAIDPSGATYKGAGELIQVPVLKQLINGVADRLEFTLSGVSAQILALAVEDRDTIRGAAVNIGFVTFDEQWQIEGPPTWEWQGVADSLSVSSQGSDAGRERSVTLSVAASDTTRSNPQIAFFTDADQRKRSPTDIFFDHVAGITAGTTRRFGYGK